MDRRDFLAGISFSGAVSTGQIASAQAESDALAAQDIQFIPTMADLRALNPRPNEVVWLRGYHNPLDGGQGLFWWDKDLEDWDNGGTIVGRAAGGPGRWTRAVQSGPISVKWFANAIAAVDFASSLSAQKLSTALYFPADEKPYNLRNIAIPDYVSLLGDGRYSQIIGKPTFSSEKTSFTRAEVANLSFDDGIKLTKAREFLFRNCRFGDSVLFDPDLLNHYNTFLHCTWDNVTKAIDCTGRNHFNKLISCRISYIGQEAAVRIGRDLNGITASSWSFFGISVEGHWKYPGPFGPCFDLDGSGHYASGTYMEIPTETYWEPGPIVLRGDGISFSFVRTTGKGSFQNLGSDNEVNGRRFVYGQSKYGVGSRHGSITVSPDSNGESRFEHELWAKPNFALVNVFGNPGAYAHVLAYDDTHIVVRITDKSGDTVNSGSYQIHWLAKA